LADVGAVKGPARLPRLPFSRREAQAILAQAPRTMALGALDFAANRTTATSPELRQYRILHIATHGLLNATNPELSGLVLSLVDEEGRPRDGFLRLHDIYNLDLAAELVVLSACQTGLGQDVKGEGIVGLTRGFMYAGAARVIVSLWRVDDEATAALMERFYAGVLGRRIAPAEALRRAQLDLARQPRWRSPYYWAGFVMQGEYRKAAAAPATASSREP
jgi:CHAT domain-containing protein